MNFKAIAEKYGTPLYVYDFDYFHERFLELRKAFRGNKLLIAYAVKSNSNLSVINKFSQLDGGADCVSIGEVKRALKAGVEKYRIIFSGVGKSDSEIREALELDILFINLESEAEMLRVEQVAKELNKQARISVRVNPNIDPQTHPYISTGLHENKFGVDIDTAKRIYLYAKRSEFLKPVGLHFHIGSQLTKLAPIRDSAEKISNLLRHLKALEIDIKFFDIGGGIGVQYRDEVTISPKDYAEAILSVINGLDVTIILEPGRFLVANGGYFLTSVLYEKKNGNKRFVIIDGAMNDLLRPSLYGAFHDIEFVNNSSETSSADIVGPICESGDFIAKNRETPIDVKSGDLLVVKSAGAYGFSMSSNYNTRGRVAEIALENGNDRLIRARETFEDLIALEEKYLIK